MTAPFELRNDDEVHVYVERLAILCGDGVPTEAQKRLAQWDVVRYRKEKSNDE